MTLIDDAIFKWEERGRATKYERAEDGPHPIPDPREEMEWLIRQVADRVSEIGLITGEDIINAAGLPLH